MPYVANHLSMKSKARNLCFKYKQTGEIFESPRGKKTKLEPAYISFILNLI